MYGFSKCVCQIIPKLASWTWQNVILEWSVCLYFTSNNIMRYNDSREAWSAMSKIENKLFLGSKQKQSIMKFLN